MEGGEIILVNKEHTMKWKAENVSVDINSDNMVVLAFQTRIYHIHCLVGRLDNNHVILVHKNAIYSLFCDVGMVVWEKMSG